MKDNYVFRDPGSEELGDGTLIQNLPSPNEPKICYTSENTSQELLSLLRASSFFNSDKVNQEKVKVLTKFVCFFLRYILLVTNTI